MKHLVLVIGLVATLPVLGQGNVNLNNNYTPAGASTKAFVVGVDGLPFPKALGRVDVLDSLGTTIINGPADGTGKVFGDDGLFFLGVTDIPNSVAGGSGTIVIRVWDSSSGPTFESAPMRNSVVVTLTGLGGGVLAPPDLSTAGNFTGMPIAILIPEPSVISLAALGLMGLCLAARRR